MVIVKFGPIFEKRFKKLKNQLLIARLKKQIAKIITNPKIGKLMRYFRKGTREIYLNPYRISYLYIEKDKTIIILDFYHKDEQ